MDSHAMAQVIICQSLTMKALVQSQVPYGMWWKEMELGRGFLLSVSFHKCAIPIYSSTTSAV